MAGTRPRLSGLNLAQSEAHLTVVFDDWGRRVEKTIDPPPLHEVLSHQTREGQEVLDAVLGSMGHAQEQEGDQCDGDLDAHRIL